METSRPEAVRDIEFFINGAKHSVSDKLPASTSLNDYIRNVAGLKGTKVMCNEAGCGCCAVTVTHATGGGDKAETMSINSCVCPLYSVDGWQISTVEGIGSQKGGFHPIQERLAKHNGTQCGYCTPGFVMSMYGLLHQNPEATQQDIEDSFDGHICRCTGYRSIMDAMRSFGSDSNGKEKAIDIEDLNKHLCPKTGEICTSKGKENTGKGALPRNLEIELHKDKWYRPLSLEKLGKIIEDNQKNSIKLFFGNTASGIFKDGGPYDVYIDIRAVAELQGFKEESDCVEIGVGTTLTKLMGHMKDLQNKPGYQYCKGVVRHLKVVASLLVRNAGCVAGNLMIKHDHPDFPSDIFTTMEAIGAHVKIFDSKSSTTDTFDLMSFLKTNMKGKVIVSIKIPAWKPTDHYRSYKITPRWQNAHAYVNAAFKIPVKDRKILSQPNIVVGGISAGMVHATKTEAYLNGKTLNEETVAEALKVMASELNPVAEPLLASPKYRSEVATNLLYKTLLEVYKPSQYKIQSGADSLERPLSFGMQTYQEKTEEFPMKQPLPKKTAPLQTSGEAQFVNDIPSYRHELAASFVLTSISRGSIKSVDPSPALRIPGVVRYIGASDLPKGTVNKVTPPNPFFKTEIDELFITKDVHCAGQAIGIVIAETAALADEGAKKVKVTYENEQVPIIELEDAIAQNSIYEGSTIEKTVGDPDKAFAEAENVVEGELWEGTQAHFYMENQVALSVPTEDGIDLFCTTQWADFVQKSVAQVTGKQCNYINVMVPRLGGAFGGKMMQSLNIASAAVVASEMIGRPVRLTVGLSTNMKFSSRRFPIYTKYKGACDANGKMKAIEMNIYVDSGIAPTPMTNEIKEQLDQGYFIPNWKIRVMVMKTNKLPSTACRGPGSVPASLISETVIEHVAKKFGQHPALFKELNLYKDGDIDLSGITLSNCTMREIWKRLWQTAEVNARIEDIGRFNKNNQWRKRGITMCPIKYAITHMPLSFPTQVSIFAGDGTVSVITSGVEMGQGLYMKVAQAVAKTLKVPIDGVKVKRNQSNVSPNASVTGGSIGSEKCVLSAITACDAINERLQPLREKMGDAGWIPLLNAAVFSGIPLYENTHGKNQVPPINYHTYMVGATETEVDILTGEYQIKRVDIMADFGESLNPTIDIGQVEGAYVMGLGAFLSEDVHFNPSTGEVLNDGTWEYKPPTSKDIPIDWRIHFLPDSPNPVGVLSSKATGEPAIGLSVGALLAIKSCVENVREDLNKEKRFLSVVAPYTVEKAQQDASICLKDLRLDGVAA